MDNTQERTLAELTRQGLSYRQQLAEVVRREVEVNPVATLKVGDKVLHSHAWGTHPIQEATVESIDECFNANEKYGEPVESILWSKVAKHAVVMLKGNQWAYGNQIAPIAEGQNEIKAVA